MGTIITMPNADFVGEFGAYARVAMLKKTDHDAFRDYEDRYLSYLYVVLKMSCTDIIKVYSTQYRTIKNAVIKHNPKKWRTHQDACRAAAGKKKAAWNNPDSGYNKKNPK